MDSDDTYPSFLSQYDHGKYTYSEILEKISISMQLGFNAVGLSKHLVQEWPQVDQERFVELVGKISKGENPMYVMLYDVKHSEIENYSYLNIVCVDYDL